MNIASALHELLHCSWDYEKANELYQQIGNCPVNKFMFSTGLNSFNDEKLREELTRLEPAYPFTVQRREKVEEEKLPEEVTAIEKEWKELYKKANHTRSEIFKRGEDGEYLYPESKRGEMAHAILNIMDEVERMWGSVDYFREHGHIPPAFNKAETELTDTVDMMKRIKNLASYISKAKGGKKYKLTIAEMEAEKAELERKIR